MQTVTPFPDFEGTPSVAMADVNGDMILDLVVGTGKGAAPEVVAYDGNDTSRRAVQTEITRFAPFDAGFTGGVNVAGADIDGNALADNIIVGTGPGMESQVKVFSSTLPTESGKAPDVFSTFTPYPGSQSGVTLATGMVELGSGRESVVTAPGPGDAPLIKTFRYDLYTPTARAQANGTATQSIRASRAIPDDRRSSWPTTRTTPTVSRWRRAGSRAPKAARRASSPASSAATGGVAVWSRGSTARRASPRSYLDNPNHHDADVKYAEIASFVPFPGAKPGVTVATSSTTYGADLLVAGLAPGGQEVRKYTLERPKPDAKTDAEADCRPARRRGRARRAVIPVLCVGTRADRGCRHAPLGQVPEHPGHEIEHHGPEQQERENDADAPPIVRPQAHPEAAAASASAAG